MNSKLAFTLTLALGLGLSACTKFKKQKNYEGTPVTGAFVKEYAGKFHETEHGEQIEIFGDGRIRLKQKRQVGREGEAIPYPTTCTYFEEGLITGVFTRSEKRRESYMSYADTLIKIRITKVMLDRSEGAVQNTPENCEKFEKAGRRVGDYSLYAETYDKDRFRLHTSGGGDYKQPGDRTASTMDENYTRVN